MRPLPNSANLTIVEVETDEGIIGRSTSTLVPDQVDQLRAHVVGEDPMHREHIWEMLF